MLGVKGLSDCKLVWVDISFSKYIVSDSPSTKGIKPL